MKYIAIAILFLFISCTSDNQKSEVREIYFYDLQNYFENEIAKYKSTNTPIFKTVKHNNSSEAKQFNNINWENELAMFLESDINKISWKNSYKETKSENKIIYEALDKNLKTQMISIDLVNKKPVKISISNNTKNYLYKSSELLEYIPDSIYKVQKKQNVILLGENSYWVSGEFK